MISSGQVGPVANNLESAELSPGYNEDPAGKTGTIAIRVRTQLIFYG